MLKRIVKMSFQEDQISPFIAKFEANKDKIRNFPGCRHVELLQVKDNPQMFFTFSIWDDEEALDAYRHSELFKGIWTVTKLMFDSKPEAWSLDFIG